MELDSKYKESGTALSGYEERGKYHCEDCIHRLNPKSDLCIHPVVVIDPEMRSRLVTIENSPDTFNKAITINLEKGCCKYVKQFKNPWLLVLRHGETKLNSGQKFRSWVNVPLDENGIGQAEEAGKFLQEFEIKEIWTSPLDRAYHTAMIVADGRDIPIKKIADLKPWNLGILSGQSRKDNQEVLDHYIDNAGETIEGGESLDDFRDRSFAVFEDLSKESTVDAPILVVGHTSTVTTLNQWIDENYSGRPETDDESVKPGGVCGLYKDADGDANSLEVIFGEEKKADYGS